MADTSIGNIYSTKIPGYDDAADIQAALRTYHYGSSSYSTGNSDLEQLVNPSIAYHLKTIQDSINAINALGTGAIAQTSMPTDKPEGYLWLDTDSAPNSTPTNPTAIYTTTAPSTPTDGTLWVVKGSSPLLMKIWDATDDQWKTIGA
jgi:hypothetical protein